MIAKRFLVACLAVFMVGVGGASDDIDVPRAARLVKDAGNQFLAAKKYADAIDCYFQALDIYPEFAEAHYNLGVSFFKGFQAMGLARHHFEQFLRISPNGPELKRVLDRLPNCWPVRRAPPLPRKPGQVLATIGGRLLIAGVEGARPGDRVQVADAEFSNAALLVEYAYPDGSVLTQRMRWEKQIDRNRQLNIDDRLEKQFRPYPPAIDTEAG